MAERNAMVRLGARAAHHVQCRYGHPKGDEVTSDG